MATVIFYEKPGCATNARQRRLLEAAGHRVEARNLLTQPWTALDLLSYFGDAPVADWFNKVSPRVKAGEIDPAAVAAETALAFLLSDPLSIRRPLIEVKGQRMCGFDAPRLQALIGLPGMDGDSMSEACGRPAAATPCPVPSGAGSEA